MRALAALLVAAAAGCAAEDRADRPAPEPPAPPAAPSLKPECGVASYYHRSLAGNPTANGEIYDPQALTAAHRTREFGEVVTVRRRDTGEDVTVVINDRGPFVDGRIIDLSRAAARAIGLTGEDGVAAVCLREE